METESVFLRPMVSQTDSMTIADCLLTAYTRWTLDYLSKVPNSKIIMYRGTDWGCEYYPKNPVGNQASPSYYLAGLAPDTSNIRGSAQNLYCTLGYD